jgi:D-3-phosphoglycerate dehydrogenase
MSKHRVLVTTVPFGDSNNYPLELMESNDISYDINPLGRKLTADELSEMVVDYSIIIAGTESINKLVMDNATRLKLISRVGIGLDSVDLLYARKKGIQVSYTPDAPAPAVSELTIGLMLSLIRSIHISNTGMHKGDWNRYFGHRISNLVVGIIGTGRIGRRVVHHLLGFGCKRVLVNDLNEDNLFSDLYNVEYVSKEDIYKNSDILSIHIPLTLDTFNLITKKEISLMKSGVILINTSRGGIINENDLADALLDEKVSSAAIDAFEKEPYFGRLASLDNCILTAHMGSMTVDCRSLMEIQATEEIVRFVKGENLIGGVPDSEYIVQGKE